MKGMRSSLHKFKFETACFVAYGLLSAACYAIPRDLAARVDHLGWLLGPPARLLFVGRDFPVDWDIRTPEWAIGTAFVTIGYAGVRRAKSLLGTIIWAFLLACIWTACGTAAFDV